ncbi:MAG: 30S ribosomal protein S16, partial [Alphaproteobacteria bacterium]|nr:30S ribosomal protein S16 [Alphaproteobacteria bacterium]
MALKIRLARGGTKKRPFYRIVVAEVTAPRDGRFIEKLGTYNPMLPKDNETRIVMNTDRIKHWLSVGAKPTDRVARFLGEAKVIPMPEIRETPKQSKPRAKTLERLASADEAKAAKAAEAKAAKEAAAAEAAAPAPAEEAKAEEAPAEEPKTDAKAEESKTEAKAEEPKAEAKAEEPKAEAKAEEPKAEAKAEESKTEAKA